jgi:hypothetical protein
LQRIGVVVTFVLSKTKKTLFFKHLLILCRVVKLADAPPCLGGGEYGKPVRANYSLKVRLLPLQQLSSKIRKNQPEPKSYYLNKVSTFK